MKYGNKLLLIFVLAALAGCGPKENKSVDLVEQGVKCTESEQYDKALDLYKKAIKLNPGSEDAYLQMALLYDEYLNDKTSAVHAYIQYLKVAQNETNRKKVEKWIKEATKEIGKSQTQFSVGNSRVQDNKSDSSVLREEQFGAVRRQLIDKYESKISALNDELFKVKDKCAKLSNENIALSSDDKNIQMKSLLNTITSNEMIIAAMQSQINADKREAFAARQAQKTLQTIITNLQASLSTRYGKRDNINALIRSNAFLMADNSKLQSEIKDIIQDDKLLKIQIAALKRKRSLGNVSPKKQIDQRPTVPLTPELLQAFENAKKELVELRRRERFNKQERRKFIETINSLRTEISNEGVSAKKLRKATAEVKKLKNELSKERLSVKHREKQLYDRTLQLKNMQQSYLNLKKQYLLEMQRRKRINSAITDIQKEVVDNEIASLMPVRAQKRRYTVQQGDSLAKIAYKMYGDKKKYKIIYDANKSTLKKANRLKIGQVLIIP